MVKVKSLDASATKYQSRAAMAQTDYVDGASGADWKGRVTSAEALKNYTQGIADAPKRWTKGLGKASNEDWAGAIRTVGGTRYAQGVGSAGPKWSQGYGPYHSIASSIDLGPRGPKGSEENYARSAKMGKAFHAKKVSG
jgi:hypothetical protein